MDTRLGALLLTTSNSKASAVSNNLNTFKRAIGSFHQQINSRRITTITTNGEDHPTIQSDCLQLFVKL
jgi:hypothetical protein